MTRDEYYDLMRVLTPAQLTLVAEYGLRQIKVMFEKDPVTRSSLPPDVVFVGLHKVSVRWYALTKNNIRRYVFHNRQWVSVPARECDSSSTDHYDDIRDLHSIYHKGELYNRDISELTSIHRECPLNVHVSN